MFHKIFIHFINECKMWTRKQFLNFPLLPKTNNIWSPISPNQHSPIHPSNGYTQPGKSLSLQKDYPHFTLPPRRTPIFWTRRHYIRPWLSPSHPQSNGSGNHQGLHFLSVFLSVEKFRRKSVFKSRAICAWCEIGFFKLFCV